MKKKTILILFLSLMLHFVQAPWGASETEELISWQAWTDRLFEKAKEEDKFVILDLEAVWCHWCHVMSEVTYKDPKVVELINAKYIPVRVDQDAHPDISLRYEDWGWPATVVFAPDGTEIVKRRGFIPPDVMVSLLEAIIKDPTPGPSVLPELDIKPSEGAFLSQEQLKALREEHLSLYDSEFGGWGIRNKLIDPNSLEYAMVKAQEGELEEKNRAVKTLDQALNLLDREWGGFYQYSDKPDWKSPHYEKIMSIQAQYLRLYSFAYALFKNPHYLEAAKKTNTYVSRFWTSPEGSFYTSQDADVDEKLNGRAFYSLKDPERVQLGKMPRIDMHIYSRENGWMIAALASLYDVTGERAYVNQALGAAEWIMENRSLPEGGFRHDVEDPRGPYLGDTLSMGQAFVSLYVSTADRRWLAHSETAARFIWQRFRDEKTGAGFITAPVSENAVGVFRQPVRQIEENVSLARWANQLFHYTGKEDYKEMAAYAMKYLASPVIIQNRRFLTGLLLADAELAREPMHLTVVGRKDDEKAKALYLAALRYPANYRRIEWWDKREGPLPNPDVRYPDLKEAAAFYCENKACSLPFFDPEKLESGIDRLKKRSQR